VRTPVAVVGATGYAGAEAVRLLAGHPRAEPAYLASHSQPGARLGDVYPHLGALGERVLEPADPDRIARAAPVAILALPARASFELAVALRARGVRVIDLGPDYRLRDPEVYARYYGGPHGAPQLLGEAVYGLAEVHRDRIAAAGLVAVPGCYPTAALLALWPAVAEGLVEPDDLIVDAKSGVSGAGRGLALAYHFGEANENLSPYALAGAHRHTPEIEQALAGAAGRPVSVTFNPHLVPMTRGLLATCYARLAPGVEARDVAAAYRAWYAGSPFVRVAEGDALPATKHVLGSNSCAVGFRVDGRVGRLVAVAAIDNLTKGAAGHGIQDLNLMMGWDEAEGLPRLGLYP
jgi:N-acetyl-gamma-glutamyl-phosphate reductase